MEDLYKKAAALKLRFDSPNGQLMVEDLFDLPLKSRSKKTANLNDIAKGLNRKLKDDGEEDFVERRTKPNARLKAKFDIVLDVIDVVQAREAAAERRELNRQKKARIMEIMAKKQDEALEGQSLEDLEKLLSETEDDDLDLL